MSNPSSETLSAYQTLKLHTKNGIAYLTLNRPGALNALNQQVLGELDTALDELAADATVRGILLEGAGEKAFAAGADIAELACLEYEEAVAFSTRGQRLFSKLEQFPKPVVAVVQGYALGGGCELAMACHFRVATEKARFGQPEVNLGIIAGYGGTQRLPRLIGKTKALELLLTGDQLSAQEALQLGLVNHVVPEGQARATAETLLQKILQKAPMAVAYTIAAVNAGLDTGKNGYELEAVSFARAIASEDGKEGTAAFLEKRKPNFTGR